MAQELGRGKEARESQAEKCSSSRQLTFLRILAKIIKQIFLSAIFLSFCPLCALRLRLCVKSIPANLYRRCVPALRPQTRRPPLGPSAPASFPLRGATFSGATIRRGRSDTTAITPSPWGGGVRASRVGTGSWRLSDCRRRGSVLPPGCLFGCGSSRPPADRECADDSHPAFVLPAVWRPARGEQVAARTTQSPPRTQLLPLPAQPSRHWPSCRRPCPPASQPARLPSAAAKPQPAKIQLITFEDDIQAR